MKLAIVILLSFVVSIGAAVILTPEAEAGCSTTTVTTSSRNRRSSRSVTSCTVPRVRRCTFTNRCTPVRTCSTVSTRGRTSSVCTTRDQCRRVEVCS